LIAFFAFVAKTLILNKVGQKWGSLTVLQEIGLKSSCSFQVILLDGKVIPLCGSDVAVASQFLNHRDRKNYRPIGDIREVKVV
jgi:hypothetical protein